VEAALAARKADAEQWAAAAAQAQAAAAAKDGELAAQRMQLEALQGDLAVEQRRLQEGLARADLVRTVHTAGGLVAASTLWWAEASSCLRQPLVDVLLSRLRMRTLWLFSACKQHHGRSPGYTLSQARVATVERAEES
jgi:hypothetical protein